MNDNKEKNGPFMMPEIKLQSIAAADQGPGKKKHTELFSKMGLFIIAIIMLLLSTYADNKARNLNMKNANFQNCYDADRNNFLLLSELLKDYKKIYGKYPSNNEQFMQIPIFKEVISSKPGIYILNSKFEKEFPTAYRKLDEILNPLIFDDKNPIFICSDGILSSYSIPYILENRNGLDEKNFNFSPLNSKTPALNKYSWQVDTGVYIYSPGALYYARQQEDSQNNCEFFSLFQNTTEILAVIFLFFSIIKFDFSSPKAVLMSFAEALAALAAFGAAFLFTTTNFTRCYRPMPFKLPPRNENMVNVCSDLLERYKQNGIINDDTYRKFKNALNRELHE